MEPSPFKRPFLISMNMNCLTPSEAASTRRCLADPCPLFGLKFLATNLHRTSGLSWLPLLASEIAPLPTDIPPPATPQRGVSAQRIMCPPSWRLPPTLDPTAFPICNRTHLGNYIPNPLLDPLGGQPWAANSGVSSKRPFVDRLVGGWHQAATSQ